VATTFAYFGNRFWTFRHRGRTNMGREYLLFFLLNGVAMLIAVSCLWVSHYLLGLDSALADNISAPGNMFLGREKTTRIGSLDDSSMEAETRTIMGRLNPNFKNFAQPVKSLSGGQRQAVAIARAVYFNARILIMDEPTAALGPAETAQVRNLVRQLKDEGIGIFLISHDIHDVFDLSDRISVMYHGRIVDTVDKRAVTPDDVLGMIILGKKPDEVTETDKAAIELRG